MSWSEGRYYSRHTFLNNTVTDLKGSAALVFEFPVVLPGIELRTLGFVLTEDGPVIGSGATPNEVTITRVNAEDGSSDLIGTLVMDEGLLKYQVMEMSLNPNQDDIHAVAEFPRAVQGDTIQVHIAVQGSGTGDQKGKLFVKYREVENREAEVDGPTT